MLTLHVIDYRLATITSLSITYKLSQFNMIVLLTSYSESYRHLCYTKLMPMIASPRGETRNRVLLFIVLHVLMSFPPNHIFKNHSNYSIEYKHIIINVKINNTNLVASTAYFQHNFIKMIVCIF
jgi:hypothetical protein